MAKKIYRGHSLKEYQKKYGDKGYSVVDKPEGDAHPVLLQSKTWWLIGDKYYQVPASKNAVSGFFKNLNTAGKTALCILGAGVVATAIAVPVAVFANQNNAIEHIAIVDSDIKDVTVSQKVLSNGSLEVTLAYDTDNKELEKLEITMGNQTLKLNEDYTLVDNKVVINKDILTNNKAAEIVFKPVLKNKVKDIKVTSVTIKNTTTIVETDDELELTATVIPDNATNKEINWEITSGNDKAEIREDKANNKFYLKGKNKGDITIKATAKDGSGKSDSKDFQVIKSTGLEYVQVGETDTCLVKAKSGATLEENLTIPEIDPISKRTIVGVAPFGFCNGLNVKTITFAKSENITTISYNAFKNNDSLISFEIPKNVETIGDSAFAFELYTTKTSPTLAKVTFESGSKLKQIGKLAFASQSLLSSITIPNSVEYIGGDAFCFTGLEEVTFEDTTNNWVYSYQEVWTPTADKTINAQKLNPQQGGYRGVVKNTIAITGDESVTVGGEIILKVPDEITVNDWVSSDKNVATVQDGVVTGVAKGECYIFVIADNGYKVGIKKITVNPKAATKKEWIEKADELVLGDDGFHYSKLEFKADQLTYKEDDEEQTFTNFGYDIENDERILSITTKKDTFNIASDNYSGSKLDTSGFLKDNATYKISDDEIVYLNENATDGELEELHINKYGYPTYEKYKEGTCKEMIYKGEPKIYCNIDWTTTKFDLLRDGQTKTLYNYAKEATKIEFVKDETVGDNCVGETDIKGNIDPVYASFTIEDEEKTLKVWSKEKIAFDNNDRYNSSIGFFNSCSNLTSIDFTNIDTQKVTNFKQTFAACIKLEEADFKTFDTSNATNMNSMFSAANFEHLDLSSFNTSKVKDMTNMFSNMYQIKSIDLSSFDTSKVTNMTNMFYSESAFSESQLKTIYVSKKFTLENVVKSEGMFFECRNIVGGNGTTFDEEFTDKTYAKIDGGSEDKGYFTDVKDKPTEDKYFYFEKLDESYYQIGGYDELTYSPSLVIPSEHDSLPISSIDSGGFDYLNVEGGGKLEYLLIPSSITTMWEAPFTDSINEATKIVFKDNVSTWKIIYTFNQKVVENKFLPSSNKARLVNYLTGNYTWYKN